MLKDLVHRVSSTLIGAVVLALAGFLATIAVAFTIYALLASAMSPAPASAVTALLFAIVVLVIAALTPKLLGVSSPSPDKRPKVDPAAATMMMEIAAMTAGAVSEALIKRRANQAAKRKQKRKSARKR